MFSQHLILLLSFIKFCKYKIFMLRQSVVKHSFFFSSRSKYPTNYKLPTTKERFIFQLQNSSHLCVRQAESGRPDPAGGEGGGQGGVEATPVRPLQVGLIRQQQLRAAQR